MTRLPTLLILLAVLAVLHNHAFVSARNQGQPSHSNSGGFPGGSGWGQQQGGPDDDQQHFSSQTAYPGHPDYGNAQQQYNDQSGGNPFGGPPPQQGGNQMGAFGDNHQQYGSQYGPPGGGGMGHYSNHPHQHQQQQDKGGGIDIGGLFSRAKNLAANAASVASSAAATFAAGGPELVPPPGFQDSPSPQHQQHNQHMQHHHEQSVGGNFGFGQEHHHQQPHGKGLGDAVAGGVGSWLGKVKGIFSDGQGQVQVQPRSGDIDGQHNQYHQHQHHHQQQQQQHQQQPYQQYHHHQQQQYEHGQGGQSDGSPFAAAPSNADPPASPSSHEQQQYQQQWEQHQQQQWEQQQGLPNDGRDQQQAATASSLFEPFADAATTATTTAATAGDENSVNMNAMDAGMAMGGGPPGAGGDPSWGFRPPSSGVNANTNNDRFQQPQQQQQQHSNPFGQNPHMQQQQQQQQEAPPPPTIVPEPQLIRTGAGLVLIADPVEFYRKKSAMAQDGAAALQVFSDFEHVLTKNKVSAANAGLEPGVAATSTSGSVVQPVLSDAEVRTLGTAEVLESAQALTVAAQNRLRDLTDGFLSSDIPMDDAAFESYTQQCQNIITSEGQLHISSLPDTTGAAMAKMGFREGWTDALKSLTARNVPTFVFSSGYGDIVTQALLQGGVVEAQQPQQQGSQYGQYGGHGPSSPASSLPLNMRIISNFARTGPDGTVRAFSSPIVHERNKNAATAAAALGFALPERPNALILGSHEDDAMMADGATGVTERLAIGFLDVQEDFALRLPGYLAAFDAIVIGEGEFTFVQHLVDDLLGIPVPRQESAARAIQNKLGDGLGRARGFFRGLDLGGGGGGGGGGGFE